MIGRCVANRPYMYLPLKGDTNDYSVNAQNPSNTGVTTTTGQFGETNGAYEWDAGADRLSWVNTIGQSIAGMINDKITFFYFQEPDALTNEFRFTANQWSADSSASFALINNDSAGNPDSYRFIGYVSSNVSVYSNNNELTTSWECYTVTIEDDTTDLRVEHYNNAVNVGGGDMGYLTRTSSSLEFRIGAQNGVNTLGDFGKMHTFRIYNKILTQGKIAILNNEKGRIRA